MQDVPKDILIQAAEGNIDAFEDVYRAACGFVYNVALRVTNNKNDAEEVVQDVFLKIYKNLENFEFKSSFKTWVYRIAVNTAINASKKSNKQMLGRTEYDDGLKQNLFTESTKAESGDLNRQEIIDSLLTLLNPDQRACIVLRNIQGLSYQEIADTLNININTVRTRLRRARETLSSRFKEKR